MMLFDTQELTDDALTDRVRVWQRRRGHRYSVDDVATAWLAIRARPDARSSLDLGCGIGSVLLMVADRLPQVRAVGVEAQAVSFALAERNVARSGLGARVALHAGDLRDVVLIEHLVREAGRFDLITGTPPYKALGTASVSPDSQRAHARVELRGGVEAYLQAAALALAPGGLFVMCAESALQARVRAGALAAGLVQVRQLDVIPMAERKARLFSVHCFTSVDPAQFAAASCVSQAPGSASAAPGRISHVEQLVLRDASGARTDAAHALRAFFGLRGNPAELPSPPASQKRVEPQSAGPGPAFARSEQP
jgi:tRNA1Val (adenine37-N6)-methyltransferase